jgi:hypothetical protein
MSWLSASVLNEQLHSTNGGPPDGVWVEAKNLSQWKTGPLKCCARPHTWIDSLGSQDLKQRLLGRLVRIWKDNIKLIPKEVGYNGVG